jgi:hypothetical protein
MSRRLPSRLAVGKDLRSDVQLAQNPDPELNRAEIAELRRSIDGVRRMVERRSVTLQGAAKEASEIDLQLDPLDESARQYCFGGTSVPTRQRPAPLFVAWMRHCNRAAANLLDEQPIRMAETETSGIEQPGIEQEALLELIDELEKRLELLSRIH